MTTSDLVTFFRTDLIQYELRILHSIFYPQERKDRKSLRNVLEQNAKVNRKTQVFLVNEKRFFLLASLLRQYSELTDICSKDMRLPQKVT